MRLSRDLQTFCQWRLAGEGPRTRSGLFAFQTTAGAGGWWIIVNSRDFKSQPRRDGQQGVLIEVIIAHSPAIGLLAIIPEDISGMRIVWIVWMFESRGAMSAIFPGDLCVQTSVLAVDGYLVIVHVITNVAIAPGISHHNSTASIVTQMTWTTWAMLTQCWQIMSFLFGKKPSRWFSPWP